MHAAAQGGDHIPGVVLVLGADHHRIDRPEQGVGVLEVPHAETLRRLPATVLVRVDEADEIRFVKVSKHGGVGRGVDMGEAHHTDPDAHGWPPSVTGFALHDRFRCGEADPERLIGVVWLDDRLLPRRDASDEVRELPLVRAPARSEVGGLGPGTDQVQGGRLGAVGGQDGAAPRYFDRVVERPWVSPVAFHVGNSAALEAQGDEGVVEAVVLASLDAAGVHPLYIAQRPAQEVEVVDQEVNEHAAAYAPVCVPVIPAHKERRSAAGAYHPDGPELPGFDLVLDPHVLGEEPDHVADE